MGEHKELNSAIHSESGVTAVPDRGVIRGDAPPRGVITISAIQQVGNSYQEYLQAPDKSNSPTRY